MSCVRYITKKNECWGCLVVLRKFMCNEIFEEWDEKAGAWFFLTKNIAMYELCL